MNSEMNSAPSLLTAQQNLYGPENEFRAEFIQHLMLVGIRGGIPNNDKHNIQLRDVVVSTLTNTLEGVVQFDRGEVEQFIPTRTLKKPLAVPIIMDKTIRLNKSNVDFK
jgi:hypothetical protein